ncbi:MAG TPA: CoB--CoM heterodisulfide reductase iron-sulfur subunit A family protein [Anaerolineae bacterium]|nr:CoB--CoM heterodisulfide reductase iron-sulfur subunit A family protein [Anaerolineae bacterium]
MDGFESRRPQRIPQRRPWSITQQQTARGPGDDPRIGVFICHCGHNIAGYLDVAALVASARSLPFVVLAQDSLFTCSDAGLNQIRTAIAEHGLNRVVVASCTPRTHEPLFQSACDEAGLNRYLFEFVNIRDQCSWVHMEDGERATRKARDLIRMGVARAALLQPLTETELAIQPAAAVIGGGMAGMTAAGSLARRGFSVTLIEREPALGGSVRHLDTLYPNRTSARKLVEAQVAAVRAEPQIEVLTSAEVTAVRGSIGHFELEVESRQYRMKLPVQAGVVVVATGAEEWKPAGMYGYGHNPAVITQQELEERLSTGDLPPDLRSVVMIQCVGARDAHHPYCGRTCCLVAMKNAMILKEGNPACQVHVLYRDIEVYGTHFEDYYAQARELGVVFTRYTPDRPPEVVGDQGRAGDKQTPVPPGRVLVYDELLGATLAIPYDLLVLSTPMVPRPGARELAQMLKVPVDEHGFFLEAHVKLRPLDFATDGIYLCGSAHWPAHLDEAIGQALGAAARAATVLSKEQIRSSGIVSRVEESLCRGCERCATACEYGAIEFVDVTRSVEFLHRPMARGLETVHVKVARVNPMLCKGCGACAVVCPTSAMVASHFTGEQVAAMIRAALQAPAAMGEDHGTL